MKKAFLLKIRRYFDAAHKLEDYPWAEGTLHGHRWEVIFTFAGEGLDQYGMVADIEVVKDLIDEILPDHEYLNEKLELRHPTPEILARVLWYRIRQEIIDSRSSWYRALGDLEIKTVELFESPDCSIIFPAEYP